MQYSLAASGTHSDRDREKREPRRRRNSLEAPPKIDFGREEHAMRNRDWT
jgi:hypothetical protein